MSFSTFQKGFSLVELLIVMAIMGVLSIVAVSSFTSTQRQARDARRKSDLVQVSKAVELYYNDYGVYPNDSNGKIAGCGNNGTTACEWNAPFEDANTVYMQKLPTEKTSGHAYIYVASADQLKFQLFARLEYDKDPVADFDNDGTPDEYGVSCGSQNCNFAITSPNTDGEESL